MLQMEGGHKMRSDGESRWLPHTLLLEAKRPFPYSTKSSMVDGQAALKGGELSEKASGRLMKHLPSMS